MADRARVRSAARRRRCLIAPLNRILKSILLARDLLLCLPALLLGIPLWLLPWKAAVRIGRFYGWCACLLWPAARRVAMINLRRAYGESMDYRKAGTWTRQIFGNLAQSIAEGIQFSRRFRNKDARWEELYRAEDPEIERKVLADPRPKIFVTGHLGSWELAAMMASHRASAGSAAVARRVDNPFLNSIVQLLRLDRHSQWIEKKGAVSECMRRLQSGHSVALLMDENGGWRGSYVNFFGRPASTRKTAALLSLATGAPIVMGAAIRDEADEGSLFKFKLAVVDPLQFPCEPESILKMTQQVITLYESWVRAAPLQWRWIHWRWKNRPDGSEETYTRRDLHACFSRRVKVTPRSGRFAELAVAASSSDQRSRRPGGAEMPGRDGN